MLRQVFGYKLTFYFCAFEDTFMKYENKISTGINWSAIFLLKLNN